jgi:hypothetical protein
MVSMLATSAVLASEPAQGDSRGSELLSHPEVIAWLRKDLGDTDISSLKIHDLRISGDICSCSDKTPHYPYAVLKISSKTSSFLARIEGHEMGFRIRPIAIQKEKKYYLNDADDKYFGEYESTCDFIDARFGPTLAPFFPDCKASRQDDKTN